MLIANRRTMLRFAAVPLLALALTAVTSAPSAYADQYDDRDRYEDRRRSGYNDEYIFAATRGVTGMDAPPYAKVPLIPITLVLDLVALPFEVVAGLF
jgi:hypothetical protein